MKCPGCHFCQQCGKNRCRLCRGEGFKDTGTGLGAGFTYGQYMAWKQKKEYDRKTPPWKQ